GPRPPVPARTVQVGRRRGAGRSSAAEEGAGAQPQQMGRVGGRSNSISVCLYGTHERLICLRVMPMIGWHPIVWTERIVRDRGHVRSTLGRPRGCEEASK